MTFLDQAQYWASHTARGALRHVPLSVARWGSAGTLPILIFHAVEAEPKPYIKHLYDCHSPEGFERVLDEALRYFKPLQDLSPEGIARAGADQFLVTFDDGLRSSYEVALPILERKGIPAIHFLITDFLAGQAGSQVEQKFKASLLIERLALASPSTQAATKSVLSAAAYDGPLHDALMAVRLADAHLYDAVAALLDLDLNRYFQQERPYISLDEAQDMARRGFVLGAHSCNHPRYWELGLDEQVRQTQDSMRFIDTHFDMPGRYFAFPYKNRGITPAFYERTQHNVDLFFTTSGWGNRMNAQRVFHRVGMDHQASAVDALKMGWRPFPLSWVQ
jgi:peptidoglycan/xylan/chitin deacetylase (PgdA/CDA1 family)